MPITKMVLILVLALLPPSCGPTDFLNPLYTKKDLVFDPLLPGIWEAKGDGETDFLNIQRSANGCYALKFTVLRNDSEDSEGPKHIDFDACLVQLGQTRFLDTEPNEIPVRPTVEKFHLRPPPDSRSESPFRPNVFHHAGDGLFISLAPARGQDGEVSQSEYELRLTPAHWIFRIWFNQSTLRLSDFEADDDLATLSTKELQRLVIKHADDPAFFSSDDSLEFHRQNGG